MLRRLLGLLSFVATGLGLMVSNLDNNINILTAGFLLIIGWFFMISLLDHYKELID